MTLVAAFLVFESSLLRRNRDISEKRLGCRSRGQLMQPNLNWSTRSTTQQPTSARYILILSYDLLCPPGCICIDISICERLASIVWCSWVRISSPSPTILTDFPRSVHVHSGSRVLPRPLNRLQHQWRFKACILEAADYNFNNVQPTYYRFSSVSPG